MSLPVGGKGSEGKPEGITQRIFVGLKQAASLIMNREKYQDRTEGSANPDKINLELNGDNRFYIQKGNVWRYKSHKLSLIHI